MDATPIASSLSFQAASAARAYARPAPRPTNTTAFPTSVDRLDTVDVGSQRAPAAARALVAATVPGPVTFTAPAPALGGAYQMHRHPADRNAAATGVDLGRRVDVNA